MGCLLWERDGPVDANSGPAEIHCAMAAPERAVDSCQTPEMISDIRWTRVWNDRESSNHSALVTRWERKAKDSSLEIPVRNQFRDVGEREPASGAPALPQTQSGVVSIGDEKQSTRGKEGEGREMQGSVLVLNSNFEPLNVCNLKRAIVLVYLGKAEVLKSASESAVHSAEGAVESPSVLRLYHQVRRPKPELRLSRRAILARDNYTCQYCGHSSRDMTIDHVLPRRLGGGAHWENLVASCKNCNSRKGDKHISQAGLALRRKPTKPRFVPYISFTKYLSCLDNDGWREFLPAYPDPRP